jgi:hypothetical protein
MTIRKLILGTVAALTLAISPAYAAECVAPQSDPVTERGTIIQSATTETEEGVPPHKFLAILLDTPICGDPIETLIELGPISMKWLGHDVLVTGNMEPVGIGPYITIKHIVDANHTAQLIKKSPGHTRTAAEKTMPIEFVGEWCFSSQENKTTEYNLPSWIEDGHCTKIISIDQYGFYDDVKNCRPVSMRLTHDTAPSGTEYMATFTARCNPNGEVTTATAGVLQTFEFGRYKGNLTVTIKGTP